MARLTVLIVDLHPGNQVVDRLATILEQTDRVVRQSRFNRDKDLAKHPPAVCLVFHQPDWEKTFRPEVAVDLHKLIFAQPTNCCRVVVSTVGREEAPELREWDIRMWYRTTLIAEDLRHFTVSILKELSHIESMLREQADQY